MKKEYNILIFLYLLFQHSPIVSQNKDCIQNFIDEVSNISQDKNKKFYKKIKKTIYSCSNNINVNNVEIVIIPTVFTTRKGAKCSREGNIVKAKLFCYLNSGKLVFDEALLYNDTIILGAIIQSPNPSKELEFIKNIDLYRRQLANVIINISPDIIFNIYNIPRCYWYIKDQKLYVLYYKKDNRDFSSFIKIKAEFFIQEYLDDEDLLFLNHKIVRVNNW